MKIEACNFSGFKIYPGHGRLFVRGDSRVFRFVNAKCESYSLQRLKPSKLDWTIVFRRLHKKGQAEDAAKNRKRKVVRAERAVAGTTMAAITAKREQNPALRAAERTKQVAAIKDAKKAVQDKKRVEAAKVRAQQPKQKISKVQSKGFAPKAAATSR